LLNNADTQVVAMSDGLLAQDVAADQRIIALIDKYDQLLLYCQDEPAEDSSVADEMAFANGEEHIAKRNRGKVLDEIIEEVYETYGNMDDEEDSRTHDMADNLGLQRRANSEVTL